MSTKNPQNTDKALKILGSVFVGAVLLRVGYEIYQIQSRVKKIEKYMDKQDIPEISQKPLIATPEYFVISDVPKKLDVATDYVSTISLFTKGQYEIVPNSLKIRQIIKPNTSKVEINSLPTNDISQGNKTIQIPFRIRTIKQSTSSLTVDFSFQIKKKGSESKQEITTKVVVPLYVAKV